MEYIRTCPKCGNKMMIEARSGIYYQCQHCYYELMVRPDDEELEKDFTESCQAREQLTKENEELKALIEKMKCCGNCSWKVKGVCNDNDNCGLEDWKLVETWR